jgi:hypothetical protein
VHVVGLRPRVSTIGANTVAHVTFERKLNTSDACDYQFGAAHLNKTSPRAFFVLGAYHETERALANRHSRRAVVRTTLFDNTAPQPDTDDDGDDEGLVSVRSATTCCAVIGRAGEARVS